MYEITHTQQPFVKLATADTHDQAVPAAEYVVRSGQAPRVYVWYRNRETFGALDIRLLAIVTDRGLAGVQTEFVS